MIWVNEAGVWKEVGGGDTLVLGQPFGGGYYIGDIIDPDDGMGGLTYALILAPKSSGQSNPNLKWKTSTTATAGTSSLTNGLANSNAMNNSSHPAAQFCRSLNIGGFRDWYLPAKSEVAVSRVNRMAISGDDAIIVDSEYCWSSTENSAASAWSQLFSGGSQMSTNKGNLGRVRAMRRVLIPS